MLKVVSPREDGKLNLHQEALQLHRRRYNPTPTHAHVRLGSTEARDLGRRLGDFLDNVKFDGLNARVRADYPFSPSPYLSASKLIDGLAKCGNNPAATLVRLFICNLPVERSALEAFYRQGTEWVDSACACGLLKSDGDRVCLDGLSLASRRLNNGRVIHFFVDTPAQLLPEPRMQRVYAGIDTYLLNTALQAYTISGLVAEMGSGSAVQLITLANLNSDMREAFGIEIDARARNVSKFNLALNRCEDRVTVLGGSAALNNCLHGRPLDFAFSNPPFFVAPESVPSARRGKAINLALLCETSGYGGPDGLAVTREFVQDLAPLLSTHAGLLFYSQFACARQDTPLALVELPRVLPAKLSAWSARFEKFPVHTNLFDFSAEDWSRSLALMISTRHPRLSTPEVAAIESGVRDHFMRKELAGITSGFLEFGSVPRRSSIEIDDRDFVRMDELISNELACENAA